LRPVAFTSLVLLLGIFRHNRANRRIHGGSILNQPHQHFFLGGCASRWFDPKKIFRLCFFSLFAKKERRRKKRSILSILSTSLPSLFDRPAAAPPSTSSAEDRRMSTPTTITARDWFFWRRFASWTSSSGALEECRNGCTEEAYKDGSLLACVGSGPNFDVQ